MSRHIQDLSPDEFAKLVRAYLLKSAPDTRKRVIPLVKNELAEYDDE